MSYLLHSRWLRCGRADADGYGRRLGAALGGDVARGCFNERLGFRWRHGWCVVFVLENCSPLLVYARWITFPEGTHFINEPVVGAMVGRCVIGHVASVDQLCTSNPQTDSAP